MFRVEDKRVGRLVAGFGEAQTSVASKRVGIAGRVKIPLLPIGPRQGPFVLVAPLVYAHDEQPQRSLVRDSVVRPSHPVIEPPKLQGLQIDHRVDAEVDIACLGGGAQGVGPRTDDQPTLPRLLSTAIELQAVEIYEGVLGVEVIPSAHD